ncbi:MAG: leucine-rich repeat protein, partial [Clostridia bacterium]|nr:leucine-rich repeat protein [Clostridia bacterium]
IGLTSIVFPDSVKTIGADVFGSFGNDTGLRYVTIGKNVEHIGWSSSSGQNIFAHCKNLESITVDPENEYYSSYNNCLIETNSKTLIAGLKDSSIPTDGRVEHIGSYAFISGYTQSGLLFKPASHESFKNIFIPSSVTSIEKYAFYGCANLENVVFDNNCNITEIGGNAFDSCIVLKELIIPGSCDKISSSAFNNCTSLKNIEIESDVIIDSKAFCQCINLETANINGATLIETNAFQSCAKLKQVSFSSKLNKINQNAFSQCVGIEIVITEDSQTDFEAKVTVSGNEYLLAGNRFYNHIHNENTRTFLRGFLMENCESSGYTGDLCCSECNWIFEKGEYKDALGHNYETTTIEPTCTSNGFQFSTCSRCGRSTIDHMYSATGHSYISKTVRPTCTDGGYTLNVCNKCGLSTITDETDPLGHDYVPTVYEATCTRDGYTLYQCSRCNASYIDNIVTATGHTYVDTEVQSTCTGTGYTSHKCSKCGDEYVTNETPANGHSYEPVTVPATCTTDGYVIYICSACGAAYRGEQIPSPGHNYRDTVVTPTCTEGGYTVHTCSTCGNTYIDSETNALGHNYTETVVEATCQHGGYTRHECQNCHDIYDTDETPALEHNLESAVVEATCTTGGFTINTCTDCGFMVITNRTNAIGHDYQPQIVIQQTCIQDGYTINICSHCGAVSKTDGDAASGHSFGAWSTVENATEDHEGLQQRHCQNCGYCEEKILSIVNRTTYTVTFKADGKTVAVVEYVKGARTIEEPAVPHKDRFEGRWENYTLNDEDIVVNAIYTVIDLDNISGVDTGESATYDPETGIATINMYAASSGKTVVTTSSEAIPLDIILVVDQSGSMDEKLGTGATKKQALINSANSFVSSVYEDAKAYDVDHRIAIVGFAMGNKGSGSNYPAYLNTEILTTGGNPVQMNNATAATYAAALMSVNNNGALNADISRAINFIDAKGATAADYGLTMANNIFANNANDGNRQRVVVFMTDGAPTYQSEFSNDVANAAILQANELKTAYGATIYCVGVMSDAEANNTNVSRFMNYVSSNYKDVKSLNSSASYVSSNYYYNVNNTSALSGVFAKIVTENITRTTDFDNITMIQTVSKYFTLTQKQETALRVNAIENYGVENGNITVTRHDNGTTTIIIRGMHPIDNGTQFVIDFSFEVSANEKANSAGVYPVGTDDSGIMLGSEDNYEFTFTVPYVTVPADRKTAVFTVNGEIYEIRTVVSGNLPVAPEAVFGGQYQFSGWIIASDSMQNGYAVYDATLAAQDYFVIWNTASGTTKEFYKPGEVINVPEVSKNNSGETFRRWNGVVPVVMPAQNLEFTAVYGDHEHNYTAETITPVTCLTDGLVKYTCSICGDTYNETISCPGEHKWIVAAYAPDEDETQQIIVCENCGILKEHVLQYSANETETNGRGFSGIISQEINMVDTQGNCYQPEGSINISMPVDDENNIYDMSVYRVGDGGEEIACNSSYDGGVISFDANHFSTYVFVPVYLCSITKNHIDVNSDNYCDICDEQIKLTSTITFIVDGETVSEQVYISGTDVSVPADPEKVGFTFSGWTPEVASKATGEDKVYVATWEAPEHTCTGHVVNARTATCTSCGNTGDTYCTVCGALMESGEQIPATGHSYGEWSRWRSSGGNKNSRYRTCSTCGYRDVETQYFGGKTIRLKDLLDMLFNRIFETLIQILKVRIK